MERCRQSDLTRREFAARAGISVSTLHLWLRKGEAALVSARSSSFVALPNLVGGSVPPRFYRLRLPGGLELEIPPGFHAEELGSLLQTIQAL